MTKKTLVRWRHIPAQVIVSRGRKKARKILTERFQKSIDRAAMIADRAASGDYLEEWHRVEEALNSDESIEELVKLESSFLETSYDDDKLERLIRTGGLDQQH